MNLRNVSLIFAAACTIACTPQNTSSLGTGLENKAGKWTLLHGGKPFFIKGAGGNGSRTLLLKSGANSIRTWGADDLGEVLDQAQKDGLKVTAGIWLGHTGPFDYGDADAVRKQFEMCRDVVRKHRNHPALLAWAFGNEMEGDGRDLRVYRAVEEIAAMAKKEDPNHPRMTVIAEIGEDKVKRIQEMCPSIDIIGVNSYGGAPSLRERYLKQGGVKPYVVTEFGPLGPWEVPKSPWGAPYEASSTEKANWYRKSYQAAVAASPDLCLGSYVFLWGHKQEATATWFGMILPDGSHVEAVDAMTEIWTGKAPANRCPRINRLALKAEGPFQPGQTVQAELDASDPEGKSLKVRWVLTTEATVRLTAGQGEPKLPEFPASISLATETSAQVKLPDADGGYRLFAYVTDGSGGAAVANVPLQIARR